VCVCVVFFVHLMVWEKKKSVLFQIKLRSCPTSIPIYKSFTLPHTQFFSFSPEQFAVKQFYVTRVSFYIINFFIFGLKKSFVYTLYI